MQTVIVCLMAQLINLIWLFIMLVGFSLASLKQKIRTPNIYFIVESLVQLLDPIGYASQNMANYFLDYFLRIGYFHIKYIIKLKNQLIFKNHTYLFIIIKCQIVFIHIFAILQSHDIIMGQDKYILIIANIIQQMQTNTLIIIITVLVLAVLGLCYKLVNKKQGKQKLSVELIEARKETHDTIIFTFALPNSSRKLGLKVGQHLEIQQMIKGEIVKRKYTPISPIDRVGSFQLLIKIYQPSQKFPSGGKMTPFLAELPLHSKITITLPFGRFNYLGNSDTRITDFQGRSVQRKYKNLYMVAGGTGITPIFQIIQYCCEKQNEQDRPYIYLLFGNRTQNDILMKSILDGYAQKNYKIKIFYSVDRSVTSNWTGFTGFVSEQTIKQTIPEGIKDTLFMSCGPPILCSNCEKFWKNLGVPNEQMYRF